MMLFYYLLFFGASYVITLMIFGFSTYHRFFWWAGPLLATFAVGQAYLMCLLGIASFFTWHLLLMIAVFIWWAVKSKRQFEALVQVTSDITEDHDIAMKSAANTMLYFFLSVLIYMALFGVGFLYIYNNYFLYQ